MGLLTAVVTYQVGTAVVAGQPDLPAEPRHVPRRRHLRRPALAGGDDHRVGHRADRALPLHPVRAGHQGVGRDRGGRAGQRALARTASRWSTGSSASSSAGMAGILIAPLVPLVPGTYTLFIVPALAAAVVGRFHSLGWAITAGLGIGALESLLRLPQRRPPLVPGRRGRADAAGPRAGGAGRPGQDHAEPGHAGPGRRSAGRPVRTGASPTAVVGHGRRPAAPSTCFTGNDRAALYTSFITAVITLSLVVVTGYTGQISLAQLTFAGVSAYILSTFATLVGHPVPHRADPGRPGGRGGRRGDRHPGAAGARPDAGRGDADVRRRRGGDLVQQQLHRRRGAAAWPSRRRGCSAWTSGIGSGKDFPRPAFGILCLVVLVLGGVRGELAAHQPAGLGDAGRAGGRALGGGGGDQRGQGQADRLRHRGLHRRPGRVAAGLPAGRT